MSQALSKAHSTRRVGIALGSNLGDRGALIEQGFAFLRALAEGSSAPHLHFLASPVWLTEPVDCPPGSPPFLNAVAEIATSLSANDLLAALQGFERDLGRPEVRPVNAPRPLDLDILYYGGERIATERLTVPHPRIAHRLFVLVPLAAIRPELVLPGHTQPVQALCDQLVAITAPEHLPRRLEAW
ncbi:2-amino-4-hydroxy-6-hydroxymethyldihydropteridine diphosphokinase [Verrucomicrobia bacterium LW23]|nr:2-amino-4-hydroxy-6-hydroxymethyldihydropteridine diphosphokinase [Verrucomicrobia bacterium LW23]